jgi:hypothetical protein
MATDPNANLHLRTQDSYPGPFNRRVDWAQKPGFWDPYTVAQICVPCMMQAVFIKQKYSNYDSDLNLHCRPDPEPCPGIKIYFQPIEIIPEIREGVEQYIKFPCKEVLKNLVHERPDNALQFLLHYLRLRGPFIAWKVDNSDVTKASLNTFSHLTSWSDNYFSSLPELDYVACILIGKYLSYVMHVAYGQQIHYMKEILSKVWGPVMIRLQVHKSVENEYNSQARIDIPIQIFKRMLSICPWDRHKPFDSVPRAMYPSAEKHFTHKYQELAEVVSSASVIPKEIPDHAGVGAYQSICARGPYEDEVLQLSDEERFKLAATPHKADVPFPPDHCNINYGGPADMEYYK